MLVDCALRLGKGNRHLMNPADFPAGNLLKGAGDNSFSEDFIEGVRASTPNTVILSGRWDAEKREYPFL